MRKLFTLLTLGAALCTTASAVVFPGTKVDMDDLRLSPEGMQKMQTMNAQAKTGILEAQNSNSQKVVMKSYSDARYTYELVLLNPNERWCDLLLTDAGKNPEFREFPFYVVYYQLMAYNLGDEDGDPVTAMSLPLCWPSQFLWAQSNKSNKYGDDIPESEINPAIVSIDDLANADPSERGKGFIYDNNAGMYFNGSTDEFIAYFPIAPNTWMGDYNILFRGEKVELMKGDANKRSQIYFTSMDDAIDTYQIASQLYFDNDAQLALEYDGDIRQQGFKAFSYIYNVYNIAVVNMGQESAKSLGWDNQFYSDSWGPVTKFCVVFAQDSEIVPEENVTAFARPIWSTFNINNEAQKVPQNYANGFVYGEANATSPHGIYKIVEPKVTYDKFGEVENIDIAPAPGVMLPYGYSSNLMPWSSGDDFNSFIPICDQYGVGLREPSTLMLGCTDGSHFYGYDRYNNYYQMDCTGNISYYPDCNDLTKVETISAVGTLINGVDEVADNASFKVVAGNGVINVVADKDAEVAVYSLAGALVKAAGVKAGAALNVNVEKGIYLVKVGKNVKKVVL